MKHPNFDFQQEETVFTPEEEKQFLALWAKVGWKTTGPLFSHILLKFPIPNSEQAVVRQLETDRWEIFMTPRPENDRWYTSGGLHLPGGYILRGENNWEWCARVFGKEAIRFKLLSLEPIRFLNTHPDTDHVPWHQVAVLWLCKVEGVPATGAFYPIDNVPEHTLGHHKVFVQHVRAYLIRKQMLHELGILDGEYFAPSNKWITYRYPDYFQEYDTLAEALVYIEENPDAAIFDDQGRQINCLK